MKKLVLLCCLFAATPMFAQNYYELYEHGLRKDTLRVELYGGMILPRNNWDFFDGNGRNSTTPGADPSAVSRITKHELGNTGWSAGVGITRNVATWFGLGLDANYAQLGDGAKDAQGGYYRTGVATGLITGRFNIFPTHAARIYVPFGIGIGHAFAKYRIHGEHSTVSGTDLAQMLGIGLEFDIDEEMILGAETRYYRINAAEDMRDAFHESHFQHLLIMLKLGWRF